MDEKLSQRGFVDPRIAQALSAVAHLVQRLECDASLEDTLDAYLEVRRRVVGKFQPMVQTISDAASPVMAAARLSVLEAMRSTFGPVAPDDVLFVRSYGQVHLTLLGYLLRHGGAPVPASRLRVVAGEQVHTERRLRELRELGFTIRPSVVAEEQHYTLELSPVDASTAARIQLKSNIKASRSLGGAQKAKLLALLEPGGRGASS